MRTTLILVLLLLSNLFSRADSIPDIVKRTKPAIVEIVAMDEQVSPTKLGTGFFISPDGLVVTNFHVIRSAISLAAVNDNGALFLFEKIVAEPTGVDLAILKFRANDVPFLRLGDSTDKVEGEKVIVIGNPGGFLGTYLRVSSLAFAKIVSSSKLPRLFRMVRAAPQLWTKTVR